MGARLRHYRRQAVRPVREHRYCPKFTPRHWAGRTHLGVGEGSRWIFWLKILVVKTLFTKNVLHEFDAESPDFGAVVESNSFFVRWSLQKVAMFRDWFVIHCRTEALRRAESGWAHGAIKATSVEIFRGY